MAKDAHITPEPPKPTVNLTTPRKQIEDALYEAGIITDIIGRLAALMIGDDTSVCGTSFDWLAGQLEQRHDAVRELISVGSFGRGG